MSVEGQPGRCQSNRTSNLQVLTEQIMTDQELRQLERENILRALDASNGKVYGAGGAAERLGLKPTTLLSRIRATASTIEAVPNTNTDSRS